MVTRRSLLLRVTCLGLSLVAVACDAADEGGPPGSDAGGASDGGGGASGSEPVHDLFACDVAVGCTQDFGHIGYPSEEEQRCGGELLVSGEPGAILQTSTPGPYWTSAETLVVLRGDGTALRQSRASCTDSSGQNCAPGYTEVWRRETLELCTPVVDADAVSGCADPEGSCSWVGPLEGCAPVDDAWSCAALEP